VFLLLVTVDVLNDSGQRTSAVVNPHVVDTTLGVLAIVVIVVAVLVVVVLLVVCKNKRQPATATTTEAAHLVNKKGMLNRLVQ